jgi:hypothetical protein
LRLHLDLEAEPVRGRMVDLIERAHDRPADTTTPNPRAQPDQAAHHGGEANGECQGRQELTHEVEATRPGYAQGAGISGRRRVDRLGDNPDVFDWLLGSILGVTGMFLGVLWASLGGDAVRWLRLRRTGTSTTGVLLSQTETDAGRRSRIRFTVSGTDHEFITDGLGAAAPGGVLPVRYDPRRPGRAVYPGGAGGIAVKLVAVVLLPAVLPGMVLLTMSDAGVIRALTTLGFLAGAALGAWWWGRPIRPAKPEKPEKAGPAWLTWLAEHQGDLSILGVVIAVPVAVGISGIPPWRMPTPLIVGAALVPYLMVRWLGRGWRELVAGLVFLVAGGSGLVIDTDPQYIWQALAAAIAGLVLIGLGLHRLGDRHR